MYTNIKTLFKASLCNLHNNLSLFLSPPSRVSPIPSRRGSLQSKQSITLNCTLGKVPMSTNTNFPRESAIWQYAAVYQEKTPSVLTYYASIQSSPFELCTPILC